MIFFLSAVLIGVGFTKYKLKRQQTGSIAGLGVLLFLAGLVVHIANLFFTAPFFLVSNPVLPTWLTFLLALLGFILTGEASTDTGGDQDPHRPAQREQDIEQSTATQEEEQASLDAESAAEVDTIRVSDASIPASDSTAGGSSQRLASQCEMCGKKTSSLHRASVEGAELEVCDDCRGFADEIINPADGADDRPSEPADFSEDLAFVESHLDQIKTLVEVGDYTAARDDLEDVGVQIVSLKQRTGNWGGIEALNQIQDLERDYEELLKTVNSAIQRENLRDEFDTLRSALERAETLIADGRLEKADWELGQIESDLDAVQQTIAQHDFDSYADELTVLTDRYEDLRSKIKRANQLETFSTELDKFRSRVGAVATTDASRDNESAVEALNRIIDELNDLDERMATAEYEFPSLREELERVEHRCEARREDLTHKPSGRGIPTDIPDAPDVSVEYNALKDMEPIGTGGNADVLKAVVPASDGAGEVVVAIKRPRMTGTLHTEAVERLLGEAETWSNLDDHNHVVGIIDYGSEPVPWIAMEYMDGGHLVERSGNLETPQALWTAISVTKGVRHAHTRGVAHLDLKPQNVLFRTVENAWDVPKVADWGLSKHLLEHSKSVEGMSPHYAAPEQFKLEFGPADNITDIYQLGTVFYELFTGQLPFEGRPTQVMRAVMGKQPTPPSEVADLPDELDEILLTALAKQKDDRYDDIIYLRDDLQELFDEW